MIQSNINVLNKVEVVILMATYNGARYLVAQIESIRQQTYPNWILVIRDDSSTDGTVEIIEKYTGLSNKIIQISDNGNKGGALTNFSALYSWAKVNLSPQYIMFCDQDDIWKPDKIEASLDLVQRSEGINKNLPLLIYSDLEIINEDGKSLNTRINVLPLISFNKILAQNYCFGCTMLLNGPLIEIIDSISDKAENHDYWVALTATGFGKALYLDNPGIWYRQHTHNVTSQGNSIKSRFLRYTKHIDKRINSIGTTLTMLNDFNTRYGDRLDIDKREMIGSYLEAYDSGFIAVFRKMLKYSVLRLGFLQNVGFLFLIFRYLKKQADS